MIEQLLEIVTDPLKEFNKKKYPDKFEAYYEAALPVLEACVRGANADWGESGRELALAAKAKCDQASRSKRSRLEVDLNLVMTIYLIPAVQRFLQADAPAVVDVLIEQWKAVFPNSQIRSTTFEQVMGGFKDRLCYITTAVCQSLDMADDCYELSVLRDFRDKQLLSSERGRSLVAHYYDTAPTIVNRIRGSHDARQIFQSLYEHYILPCIRLIEQQSYDQALTLYQQMVEELEGQFLINQQRSA
ncbi:MAG: CFI-box-CTERM domain-containing protein [Eubacteriales bacterium]|nr:CFI-box-CTERM domain-containing protein [Eubacteriales bacterium]